MTAILSALARAELVNLAANAAVSADGSATGIDMTQYDGIVAVVLTAVAGGTGALDTFLEESDALSSGYTDIPATRLGKDDGTTGAYTQITSAAVAEARYINVGECKKYVRVRNDVTGSTSITRAVVALAQKKYQT